ncbi:MAG TPA: hypothetical protein VF267_03450 [Gammaproteobacteria bacterium]
MTVADAEIVLKARKVLKEWDGPPAPEVLADAIRDALAPLFSTADGISSEAREKLGEISSCLDQMIGQALTPEQLDALDILMLGLWIRIELLGEIPPGK